DAVPDVQRLRDVEGAGRVLGRHRAVAPRVAAGERDAVVDEPGGQLEAGAGLAGEVGRGVVPVGAPAGVEEHGVARLRLDPGDVGGGDDVAGAEPPVGHVHEQPARDDLRHGLDAEGGDPVRLRDLGDAASVVRAIAD